MKNCRVHHVQTPRIVRDTKNEKALGALCWLEELDWIPVGVLDLDLSAARPDFHLVPEEDACATQCLDDRGQVFDPKHNSIRSTGSLNFSPR